MEKYIYSIMTMNNHIIIIMNLKVNLTFIITKVIISLNHTLFKRFLQKFIGLITIIFINLTMSKTAIIKTFIIAEIFITIIITIVIIKFNLDYFSLH